MRRGASAARTRVLCGDEGVELIKQEIQQGANALVVAACSPRFNADTFTFDGCLTERVNLREHVVWSHPANDEDTQMLAEDYLRMGIARAKRRQAARAVPRRSTRRSSSSAAGHSGMTAALAAARPATRSCWSRRKPQLGGWLRKFTRQFPDKPPYRDLAADDLESTVRQIERDPRIKVYLGPTIEDINGQPGQFDVSLRPTAPPTQFRVGAIVQATGWKPYDASRLGHLGYGRSPNVITNVQMEELLAAGQAPASVRRQAGPADRLHPVRRLARRGPSALLLGRLLPRDAETGPLGPGAGRPDAGLRPLQGHPHAGTVRRLLPPGPGRPGDLLHQGRSALGGRSRPITTCWSTWRTR